LCNENRRLDLYKNQAELEETSYRSILPVSLSLI
jgi:hypothetical protein